MAYSRKSSAKRSFKGRKPKWYNRKYSPSEVAYRAFKGVQYLKGLVNSERMYLDNTLTLGASQSQIFGLTSLAQGDASNNRTGNSILLRSLYMRGRMEINSAVTSNTRICILLIKDKQQVSDTSPGIADIVTSSTDPDTLVNRNTAGRFKILWRKNYILTPVSGGRNAIDLSKYWKVYDHVRFNGTASSDIQKNGYYLVVITSESANYPTVVFNARTGYHDN